MKNEFSILALPWILLSLLCLGVVITGIHKTLRKTSLSLARQKTVFWVLVIILCTWPIGISLLAYSGFFSDFSKLPPRPALAVFLPLPAILVFAFSRTGTTMLQSIPPYWLILMQSFRIPVEFLIWLAFLNNKIPIQMCFEGANFDLFTGLLALPAAWMVSRKKSGSKNVAVAFNITGLLLLLNILVIAILSMPTPLRYFTNEPSNTIVAEFPFILLPGLLVPLAYGLHILSLRQIWIQKRKNPARQIKTAYPDQSVLAN